MSLCVFVSVCVKGKSLTSRINLLTFRDILFVDQVTWRVFRKLTYKTRQAPHLLSLQDSDLSMLGYFPKEESNHVLGVLKWASSRGWILLCNKTMPFCLYNLKMLLIMLETLKETWWAADLTSVPFAWISFQFIYINNRLFCDNNKASAVMVNEVDWALCVFGGWMSLCMPVRMHPSVRECTV